MGSMRAFVPVFLLLTSIVAACINADVSCDTAVSDFLPCVELTPPGKNISDACCNGLRKLNEMGSTPEDSKFVCYCLKPALISIEKLPPEFLEEVESSPERCGVHLPYKLDPSTDCNSLN